MASHVGGRWDVGTRDNAVYVERISDSDERVFDDLLESEEARELAGLLTKYADKADKAEDSNDAEDSEDSGDSGDSDESEDSDDSDDSED
jgi:hypothetical protein